MAIITLALFKTFLEISDDSEDEMLQIYVDAANEYIKKYTHRDLELTDYSEELYDGTGTPALVLRQYPLISVTEILDANGDGVSALDDPEDTDDGYYIMNTDHGILYHSSTWEYGRYLYRVSYTAGYETIPQDLKLAALAVANYFRNTAKKTGIRGESLGSYSYTLSNDVASMGSDLAIPDVLVQNILNRYRMRHISSLF